MVSGGARGRSGPAPDPNALRRDRDSGDWIVLPAERTGPIPDWPLHPNPSPQELRHWEAAWRKPQATQWEKNGQEVEVALYVRTLAEAELPGAAANLRNLVKQLQENLGLSFVGLNRFRWRISGASTPAATASDKSPAARPARGRSSSRDRFKVIPGSSD